jgi:hypothetical protein
MDIDAVLLTRIEGWPAYALSGVHPFIYEETEIAPRVAIHILHSTGGWAGQAWVRLM